jgi:ribose transport system ATP-binding protein
VELSVESLTKRHPGVLALDRVSLVIRAGEIHAVAGENGAGKSTLMRVLSGATAPDSGTIRVDGRPVRLETPQAAHRLGIRMIHQELSLVPEMSVVENIMLGAEPARFGLVDRAAQRAAAVAALARVGQSALDADAPVHRLALAARQMTEIARALVHRANVLILDEPTAILSQDESEALFAVLGQLRADGVAIVYVSHRMEEIFRLADQITVLRDGRVVSTAAVANCTRAGVVRDMVGRELADGFPPPSATPGEEVLRVTGLRSGLARDVTFAVRRGEIVALVGLVGSGRTDVVRAIFGAAPVEAGSIELATASGPIRSPRDAIAAGLALLPEDRKRQGLVLESPVRENVTMASLAQLARHGVVDRVRERAAVAHWIDALAIRTTSQQQAVRTLSGGNQQKVVLARWLLAEARVLLFDEPTRGIDIGAKAEIYALMRRLTAAGVAILMISSELPEALGMADRVVVMRDGRTVGELPRERVTTDAVAALILGETRAA